MMRSTKIKIAIALGLTSAVGLGLLAVSSPVDADDVFLKISADNSFSGKTLQLLKNGSVVQNYSPPTETSYNRTSGEVYKMKIKGDFNCEFYRGDLEGTDVIPDSVSEIYLNYENNLCRMDEKPFGGEPVTLNVYAKNINNQGIKLIGKDEYDTETIIYDNISNNTSAPAVKVYKILEDETATISADFYGTVKACTLGSETKISPQGTPFNLIIDAENETCNLYQSSTKIELNVTGAASSQRFIAYLGYGLVEDLEDCPDYYRELSFNGPNTYVLDVVRSEGIVCASHPIVPHLYYNETHLLFCEDAGKIPFAADVANIILDVHYGNNFDASSCDIRVP